MGKFTFGKEERLSKEKLIKELFEKGSSFHLYPFRVIFHSKPEEKIPVHQILISVSVRNFKRAVDRNLIKRRIREGYRLQKELLPSHPGLLIAFIYTAKTIEPFKQIKPAILKAMETIPGRMGRTKGRKDALE